MAVTLIYVFAICIWSMCSLRSESYEKEGLGRRFGSWPQVQNAEAEARNKTSE